MSKKNNKGLTLVELMVTVAILSIVLAGVYTVYINTSKHSLREYRVAESEMELEITKNFIERDIAMAGYGLADDYDFDDDGIQNFTPTAIGATDGGTNDSDTLTLMGTALGRFSRAAQGWTHVMTTAPTFQQWNDAREDLNTGDKVIFIEPNTKSLVGAGGLWEFDYPSTPAAIQEGTLVYGIDIQPGSFPYYAVEYSLGGTTPAVCAPGTQNLQRAEDRTNVLSPQNPLPLLACVLDLQIVFGLDTNEDGTIDSWDNGGTTTASPPYTDYDILKKRLKQVRVYMLVQLGSRNLDEDVYPTGTSFRVGDADLGGGIGRDVVLTDAQRRYRWKVVSLNVTPRNLR